MFQDYVASCVIRAARELFGRLPFDKVLVTACLPTSDLTATELAASRPVLSVIFPRGAFSALPFDSLDPSDTVETFPHRGDVKASRKTGEFIPIVPLTRDDLSESSPELKTLEEMLAIAREHRTDLEEKLLGLTRNTTATANTPQEEE
jgi:hypothetical protein